MIDFVDIPHGADRYGWTQERWSQAREAGAGGELLPARIIARQGTFHELMSPWGPLRAQDAGSLAWSAQGAEDLPQVGDWVLVRLPGFVPGPAVTLEPDDLGQVTRILPRVGVLRRLDAEEKGDVQILGVNLDLVIMVWSLDRYPDRRPWNAVHRMYSLVSAAGLPACLILSKADTQEAGVLELLREEGHRDFPSLPIHFAGGLGDTPSIAGGPDHPWLDHRGIRDLLSGLLPPGTTGTLLGASGAGKSSIIAALAVLAGQEGPRLGAVREDDRRGRHTTTHRQLWLLDHGALLLDSPGIRTLGLTDDAREDTSGFEELMTLAARCRFADCGHGHEPGCAVRDALETGKLDRAILERWTKHRAQEAHEHRREVLRSSEISDRDRWEADADRRRWKKISASHQRSKQKGI